MEKRRVTACAPIALSPAIEKCEWVAGGILHQFMSNTPNNFGNQFRSHQIGGILPSNQSGLFDFDFSHWLPIGMWKAFVGNFTFVVIVHMSMWCRCLLVKKLPIELWTDTTRFRIKTFSKCLVKCKNWFPIRDWGALKWSSDRRENSRWKLTFTCWFL